MRVLFVNAINPHYDFDTHYPSLGLAYIATYIRNTDGHEVRILNSDALEAMKAFAPDIVGISAVTQNMYWAIQVAEYLKRECPGVVTVLGGPHQTALPDVLDAPFDYGSIGEGEDCMLDVVRALAGGKQGFHERMAGIPGVVYRQDGQVLHNHERKALRELDYLGIPDRDLIGEGSSMRLHMITSRGCPYRCIFCASAFNVRTARYASPRLVIDEIKLLIDRYKVKEIKIYDDLFTAHRTRLQEIAGLMDAEGLNQVVHIECTNRANLTTKDLLQDCKKLGVTALAFGFESGSQKVLELLKTDSVDVEQNRRSIQMCRDTGIEVRGSFIIGTPGETNEDLAETYEFVDRNRLDGVKIYVLTPLPGTPVWIEAEKDGKVSRHMDWKLLHFIDFANTWKDHIILNDKMTREEIRDWYTRFQRLAKRRELEKMLKRASMRSVVNRIKHPSKLVNDARVIGQKIGAMI